MWVVLFGGLLCIRFAVLLFCCVAPFLRMPFLRIICTFVHPGCMVRAGCVVGPRLAGSICFWRSSSCPEVFRLCPLLVSVIFLVLEFCGCFGVGEGYCGSVSVWSAVWPGVVVLISSYAVLRWGIFRIVPCMSRVG